MLECPFRSLIHNVSVLPMITFRQRTRYSAAFLLLLVVETLSQAALFGADAELVQQVEQLLPDHVGAAVLAIDHGDTILKHAWGKARVDQEGKCTTATNFRLASVSKQFTATAILRLVDQGKVRVSDTLDHYFQECPDYWHQLTVHHLLTHSSGLPDYENLIPEGTQLQLTDLQVLTLLRETTEPLFPPGSKFAYSNSGYTLLGLIVEVASGRPFQLFMEQEVFAPADMPHSVLFVEGLNVIPNRAFGHTRGENGDWQLDDQSLTSAIRGDGGVYSSLDDLEHWLTRLDGKFILSDKSRKAMFTEHIKTDRHGDSYGYGWFLGTHRGERREMHAGSTRGFSLMMQRFPARKAAVVVLLNREGDEQSSTAVQKIVDKLLFDTPPSQKSASGR